MKNGRTKNEEESGEEIHQCPEIRPVDRNNSRLHGVLQDDLHPNVDDEADEVEESTDIVHRKNSSFLAIFSGYLLT